MIGFARTSPPVCYVSDWLCFPVSRFTTMLVIVLAAVVPSAHAQSFGWSVSNSTTTALSNTGAIAPGPSAFAGNLYLWLYCNDTPATGMAAMECDVIETRGGGAPTGFTGLNGCLNAGSPTALLLAIGGCPRGPLIVGSFAVGPDAFLPDIEICLVPSAANNRNITVACGGVGYNNDTIGFAKTGNLTCADIACVDMVTDSSWGKAKALFR